MPKRGRRKPKSGAWKNLVRAVKRGPKRVKMSRRRARNGVNPLSDPEESKRIQIVLKGFVDRRLGVAVLKSVFGKMGLEECGEYSMHRGELTRAARLLKKAIDVFGHNDFVLGGRIVETKLDNWVGKCVVLTGSIKNPNATLIIYPTETQRLLQEQKSEEVDDLTSATPKVVPERDIHADEAYASDSSDGWSD